MNKLDAIMSCRIELPGRLARVMRVVGFLSGRTVGSDGFTREADQLAGKINDVMKVVPVLG
jgi:hypothetical protein